MTSLTIQQGNVQENVSPEVIDKLYQLARLNETNDGVPAMSLTGVIAPSAAYDDAVAYLRGKFSPGLTININADNCYVRFAESVIQQAAVTLYGDGIGITSTQLASIRDKYSLNKGYNKTLLSEEAASEIHTLEDF